MGGPTLTAGGMGAAALIRYALGAAWEGLWGERKRHRSAGAAKFGSRKKLAGAEQKVDMGWERTKTRLPTASRAVFRRCRWMG